MIYFVWESLSIFLNKTNADKKKAALFLVLILWIIMSFRSLDMGINDVRGVYYPLFLKAISSNFSNFVVDNGILNEPVMRALTWIIAKLFGNFQIYLSIMSLVSLLGLYFFICNHTNDILHSLLIYFSFFYFYNSYLIKQMLALSFVLFAYISLNKQDNFKYIFFILIASSIHKSALVLLPMFALCKFLKFNKYFFLFIILGVAIGIFGGNLILELLYKMSFYKFESYIKNGIYSSGGSINFSIILYVFLTIASYICLRNRKSKMINNYLILMFFGCVVNSWSIIIVEFYRLAIYFMTVAIIVIPEALSTLNNRYKKIIIYLVYGFICVYAFKIAQNCNCLPYQIFVFE